MFENRTDAGEQLADRLESEGIEADIVVGIPRGGLPVAAPVAKRLNAPLDIVAAKKMGLPGNPELAIGAAASDGSAWINDAVVDQYGVDDEYLESERERAAETAAEKLETYRVERPEPDFEGERVVVVDDGIATGATARACLRQLREAGAEQVVLAVPVGPRDTLDELEDEADRVVAVERPSYFGAVGRFYRDFGQVTDEEAREYLGGASSAV